MFSNQDKKYMELALRLAGKARGKTRPNPMVGAVIVKDGTILSTGYHKQAGLDHAETAAIKAAGQSLEGAKIYVTLEPCTFYGQTPPCVDQLIKQRFSEVIIGSRDPNPKVCGKGIARLKQAGILVREGLLAEKAAIQNEEFFKNMNTGLPLVTSKIAASLDGQISTCSGDSKWITSDFSRNKVQMLRKRTGCILTGIGTVIADNPFLFPREKPGDFKLPSQRISSFWRVVLDTGLKISLDSNIARSMSKVDTIIFTSGKNKRKEEELRARGAHIEIGDTANLKEILSVLYGNYGITSVLLEAGPKVNTSFLKYGMIDKLILFFAPMAIGETGKGMFADIGIDKLSEAKMFKFAECKRSGSDLMLTCYPN